MGAASTLSSIMACYADIGEKGLVSRGGRPEQESVNWFTTIDHMFAELCDCNFRYSSQFLRVGCDPITVEMLPYPKVLG